MFVCLTSVCADRTLNTVEELILFYKLCAHILDVVSSVHFWQFVAGAGETTSATPYNTHTQTEEEAQRFRSP